MPPTAFDADRAVRLLVNGETKATGYSISTKLVLTCAHEFPVEGMSVVAISRNGHKQYSLNVLRSFPTEDIAVLECLDQDFGPLEPVTFGLVEATASPLSFVMYGWPYWSTELTGGKLLEGGRTVRGMFEPGDTSSEDTLVLQPTRTGAGLGWGGMSGASVFALDRLVGVQSRQLNVKDASSIEARRLGQLADNESFLSIAAAHGLAFEDHWTPGTSTLSPGLLEIHGPADVPLLAPVSFEIVSQGWENLQFAIKGAESELAQSGKVSIGAIDRILAFFGKVNDLNAACEIEVIGSDGHDSIRRSLSFHVAPSEEADLVDAFELVLDVLGTVYGMGSPTRQLRAASACELGLRRIKGSLGDHLDALVAAPLQRGLHQASICLAIERQSAGVRLYEPDYTTPSDDHEVSKHARYWAEEERATLRALGFGLVDGRPFEELHAMYPLLGQGDRASFRRYIDPPLKELLREPSDFARGFINLLLDSPYVNVESTDFTGSVRVELFDLVNALYTAGWVTWVGVNTLALTAIGRAQAAKLV